MSLNLNRIEDVDSIISGNIDVIDLKKFSTGSYCFRLKHLPLRNSVILQFGDQNWITSSKYKIVKIVSNDTLEETINGITYLPYTSLVANRYVFDMIGESFYKENLVRVTKENCYLHKYHLVGRVYIDFTDVEQIRNVLDSIELDGSKVCQEFSVTYFYEVPQC